MDRNCNGFKQQSLPFQFAFLLALQSTTQCDLNVTVKCYDVIFIKDFSPNFQHQLYNAECEIIKALLFLWANITEILCEINGENDERKRKTIWRKKRKIVQPM